MGSIVFESNMGVVFEKTLYKNGRCKLTVKLSNAGRALMIYRYKDAPGLVSPYISWENLNCCNGWHYDETYLYAAVQRGLKLFADITFAIHSPDEIKKMKAYGVELLSERDVEATIQKLEQELPERCLFIRRPVRQPNRSKLVDVYIYRAGAIGDYISIGDVFTAYEGFGAVFELAARNRIADYCRMQIAELTAEGSGFDFLSPRYPSQLLVTGLLLGYPIETTAALLERDHGLRLYA